MKRVVVLLASALFVTCLSGCTADKSDGADQNAAAQSKQTADSPTVEKIDPSIAEFSAIAVSPKPELTLTDDNESFQVANCREFIRSIEKPSVGLAETTENMLIYAEYQPCVISWLLNQAQPAPKSFLKGDFSDLIIRHLDLTSFPSSLGPRLEEGKQTLNALSLQTINTSATQVAINDAGWIYEFTLLARGDFTAEAGEDLLVRFLDQAGDGSYFSLQTLVLERTGPDSKVTAREALSLLKQQH